MTKTQAFDAIAKVNTMVKKSNFNGYYDSSAQTLGGEKEWFVNTFFKFGDVCKSVGVPSFEGKKAIEGYFQEVRVYLKQF